MGTYGMTALEHSSLGDGPDAGGDVASEDIVALLDASYTQSILDAIQSEPKPVRALLTASDASRPTLYRRLNSLQDAGLVESSMEYDADGHHRAVFEASFEKISIDVSGADLAVTVVADGSESPTNQSLSRASGD